MSARSRRPRARRPDPSRVEGAGNRELHAAMVDLRRSSAAQPHTPATSYRRRAKHREDWSA